MNQDLNLFEEEIEVADERTHKSRSFEIKRIVEALLFATSDAIPLLKLKEIISTVYPIRSRDLEKCINELKKEYSQEKRGFQIEEIAHGYLLRTTEQMAPFVELLCRDKRAEKLSKAASEVLAIIACRHPITRREVEGIRGVDSSGVVASLLERGLIEPVGRKNAPGKPMQYGVTKRFLQHFGLKNSQDLLNLIAS